MKIWAHRGCSQRYPENTLLAFEKAAELKGLTGIELDIQLTKDGELVVLHDERVDRTTEGIGYVRDFTLNELKKLHIYAGENKTQTIPTMEEVLELLESRLRAGDGGGRNGEAAGRIKLNIELKNSIYPYFGMEEKIVELIAKKGVEEAVVYSSFYAKSLAKIRLLNPQAELGILDSKVSDCLYKARGSGIKIALHPFWKGMDLEKKALEGYTVRAWLSGHLYPEKPTEKKLECNMLEKQGITDVILNEPERYVGKQL